MDSFYNNPTFSDIEVVAGDKSYACHRVVLAMNSPYLRTMLTSSYRETHQKKITFSISSQAFEIFLKHIYKVPIDYPLSIIDLVDLLEEVNIFGNPSLIELIAFRLKIDKSTPVEDIYLVIRAILRYGLEPFVSFANYGGSKLSRLLKLCSADDIMYLIGDHSLEKWRYLVEWSALHNNETPPTELIEACPLTGKFEEVARKHQDMKWLMVEVAKSLLERKPKTVIVEADLDDEIAQSLETNPIEEVDDFAADE